MTNTSMILVSLGMIVLFLGPFIIMGAIKDRKKARRNWIYPRGRPWHQRQRGVQIFKQGASDDAPLVCVSALFTGITPSHYIQGFSPL
jgi:hypothetical protein